MDKIREIVEDPGSPKGRWFAAFIQTFIILSILAFCLETVPEISKKYQSYLYGFEVISISIFSVEYLIRLIVSEKKLKFIFSFYGLIDLIAILPFYLRFAVDLRALRIFRLLRAFRVLKLFRYSNALQKLGKAFLKVRDELVVFGILTLFFLFLTSVGIYYFENRVQPENFKSVFHSMWWAVATLTTVGYGDIYPITVGGKIFTFIMLMIGLGIVAVPAGLIASAFSDMIKKEKEPGNEDN